MKPPGDLCCGSSRQVWKEEMRVRNRKGMTEHRGQSVCGPQPEAKEKWRDLFGNDHPIPMCRRRKGAFRIWYTNKNPDINYRGIDIQKSA